MFQAMYHAQLGYVCMYARDRMLVIRIHINGEEENYKSMPVPWNTRFNYEIALALRYSVNNRVSYNDPSE